MTTLDEVSYSAFYCAPDFMAALFVFVGLTTSSSYYHKIDFLNNYHEVHLHHPATTLFTPKSNIRSTFVHGQRTTNSRCEERVSDFGTQYNASM
jgi:hypothetical protein